MILGITIGLVLATLFGWTLVVRHYASDLLSEIYYAEANELAFPLIGREEGSGFLTYRRLHQFKPMRSYLEYRLRISGFDIVFADPKDGRGGFIVVSSSQR